MSYYTRDSGLGRALTELGMDKPLHVGAIGLGSGTIAAYARPGDTFQFYEINPAVPGIAKGYFHYLETCGGECNIVLGDARLSLEREEPQGFDLLAVDEASWAALAEGTPIRRATLEGIARNAAIVLGNRGDPAARPPLARAATEHPSPMVREAAAWALRTLDAKARAG